MILSMIYRFGGARGTAWSVTINATCCRFVSCRIQCEADILSSIDIENFTFNVKGCYPHIFITVKDKKIGMS